MRCMKMRETDFVINSRPHSISLECPHCDSDIEILWRELDVPEYWGDDWGDIECPHCGKAIKLGDYDYA